jgi:RimJ/RimL family protein N-acetyltransferase
MSAPPKTVLAVTAEEEQEIRNAVRRADPLTLGPGRVLATAAHAAAVYELLADPAVSEPIYDLPRPLTHAAVAAWIAEAELQRERGEALLVLTIAPDGTVMGYSKITVWPDRSAAELAGAIKRTLQNTGSGGSGAARTIGWIFATLKVRLICLTAALDNVRSAKLIDRMGFRRMGERENTRPDGTPRRSLYWELTADEWRSLETINARSESRQ